MEEKKKERELKAKASPSIDLEVIASVLPHNIGTAEKKVAIVEMLRRFEALCSCAVRMEGIPENLSLRFTIRQA